LLCGLLCEFALRVCFASLLCEFALRVCFADCFASLLCGLLRCFAALRIALSLLLNHKETNHFYILSSKNRTYRNIVMKLRFDIKLLDFIKKKYNTPLAITYDASHI
jgi:hypothetical protein